MIGAFPSLKALLIIVHKNTFTRQNISEGSHQRICPPFLPKQIKSRHWISLLLYYIGTEVILFDIEGSFSFIICSHNIFWVFQLLYIFSCFFFFQKSIGKPMPRSQFFKDWSFWSPALERKFNYKTVLWKKIFYK